MAIAEIVNKENILDEYKSALDSVNQFKIDRRNLAMEMSKVREYINNINNRIREKEADKPLYVDRKIKEELQKLEDSIRRDYGANILEWDNYLAEIKSFYDNKKNNLTYEDVKNNYRARLGDIVSLTKDFKEIEKMFQDVFGSEALLALNNRIDQSNLKGIDVGDILGDADTLDRLKYDISNNSYTTTNRVDKFMRALLLDIPIMDRLSTSVSSVIYVAYIAMIGIAFYKFGAYLIAGYFVGLIFILINSYIKSKKLKDLYLPYRKVMMGLENFEKTIKEKVEELYTFEMSKIDEEYKEKQEEALSSIKELNESMEKEVFTKLNEVDREKLAKEFGEGHERDIASNKEMVAKKKKELDSQEERMNVLERNTNLTESKRMRLKSDIIKIYVGLETVGTDKLLMDKFLLGFSATEELMLLDYGRKAMCILYEGEVEHTVNLLKLIISQIYAKMDASCVNIRVVDTVTSGTRLSLFHNEDTGGIPFDSYDMWISTDDTSQGIKMLDESIYSKNRNILRMHKSIHDYNEEMHANGSSTEDYTFVILYNYDGTIFEGEEMRRMIVNSYQYGIIPIVLMDLEFANNAEDYKDDVNVGSYVRLFQALDDPNNYFLVGKDGNSRKMNALKDSETGEVLPVNEWMVRRFRKAVKSNE